MKIFCCFPYIGIEDALEFLHQEKIPSKRLYFSDLLFKKVPYTEEEIEEFNLKFRIGYEGYYKIHGEYPSNSVKNENYDEDCIKRMMNTISSDEYKYIFFDFNLKLINHLIENKYTVILVYPAQDLKAEYIGNKFIKGDNRSLSQAQVLTKCWDTYINLFEDVDNVRKVILSRGMYLEDILKLIIKHGD